PSSTSGAAILAVAGEVSAGKSNVGVSIVVNQIAQANEALIEGVSVTSSGGALSLSASNDAEIIGVAVGLDVASGSLAGVGSVVYNSIADGVEAQIGNQTNAGVTGVGAINAALVSVQAEDGSSIR